MKESIPLFKNIEKLLNLEFEKENYDRAKENLLDYIAVTYAGSKATSNILKDYIELNQVEEGSYHIYGTQYHTNFEEAVFLNGLNAHFLDYDDGSNAGIIHFGSPIYSLLIPLAKKYKMNLNEVLRASMIAYEFAYTLANMIQPKHKLKGYHATGTIGTISSALAGAVLLGYDLEKIKNTISIASSASSGLLNVLDGGSELKAFNVAKAALMGCQSLKLGNTPIKGSKIPFSGDRGFFKIFYGDDIPKEIEFKRFGTYAVNKAYTKPYAACRYTHPAIEAAIYLSKENNLKHNEIENILVETYDLAVKHHDHTKIENPSSAKMSIPYSVAVGIIDHKAGLKQFSQDYVDNQDVIALTQKVKVEPNKAYSDIFPEKQKAKVTIYTSNSTYEKIVDFPKGEPENPLNKEEFYTRYVELMTYSNANKDLIEKIYNQVIEENNLDFNLI